MNIYYWSPFITHVATVRSVINSASSLNSYSDKYSTYIINVAGEWNIYKKELSAKNIKIINLTSSNIIDNKKVSGFFKSRFIYIYLFIISLFPLFHYFIIPTPYAPPSPVLFGFACPVWLCLSCLASAVPFAGQPSRESKWPFFHHSIISFFNLLREKIIQLLIIRKLKS